VGEIFRTCPDRPWGPSSLLYNGYWAFPGGKNRPGLDADSSSTSSVVGHERVELCLYSPNGPYGLYRASVPVQGCILPFYHQFHSVKVSVLLFSRCFLSIVVNNGKVTSCRTSLHQSRVITHLPYRIWSASVSKGFRCEISYTHKSNKKAP
jgi:hypothetical protein